MSIKPALSVIDQLKLLQQRGMLVEDTSAAGDFLLRNNYYRLNIYFHKFMSADNCFQAGTKFEDIATVYYYDRWLRNRLLTLLEPIEIHIKTRIAYHLSRNYGSDCFYQKRCFKNEKKYLDIVADFDKERGRNFQDPVVIHHEAAYQGVFPIWVIVEFLSFNSISSLYYCLHEQDKKEIAKQSYGMNENYLTQWLHTLGVLRNICAHYGYLYQREFSVRPRLFREFGWGPNINGSLFAMCLVLKYLSEKHSWEKFIKPFQEHTIVPLVNYGFPANWKRYLLT
jgi:abortive infection bacteriophage resistance protein